METKGPERAIRVLKTALTTPQGAGSNPVCSAMAVPAAGRAQRNRYCKGLIGGALIGGQNGGVAPLAESHQALSAEMSAGYCSGLGTAYV